MLNRLNKNGLKDPRNLLGFIVVVFFTITGVHLLFNSHAASPYAVAEAESGNLTTPATAKNDPNASGTGNNYVLFGGGSTSYDATVLADHPVAFWAMNSTSNTETDLTGNGHTGNYCFETTYEGGRGACPNAWTPPLTTMPNGDSAAVFNESSPVCTRSTQLKCDYMKAADSDVFSIPTTKQLTLEAWIRPDVLQFPYDDSTLSYTDWAGKCETYGSPATCEWEGRMYNASNSQYRCDMLDGYAFNSTANQGQSGDWQPAGYDSTQIPAYTNYGTANCTKSILQAGQWLHVVIEFETLTTPSGCNSSYPGAIYIWVNGVLENFASHVPSMCMGGSNSITPGNYSSPVDIGTMAHDAFFDGAIGKVAIYDTQLSQTQINNHFMAMTGAAVSGSCGSHGDCTIPVPTQ